MMRSESIAAIAPALIKAQASIGAAKKDTPNPFFKSTYADLATVIEAVKEPLNSNGIAFLQAVTTNEQGVCVETVLLHSSGEWVSEMLTVPVAKHDAQGVGSAISYGKRYGLQSLTGVPSVDDDGNAATKKPPKLPESAKTVAKAVADTLPPGKVLELNQTALLIADVYRAEGVTVALDEWERVKAGMEPEDQIATWGFLDSKIRSHIKRVGEERRLISSLKDEKNAVTN